MFLPRVFQLFILQHRKGAVNASACAMGLYHFVNIAELCRAKWGQEFVFIILDMGVGLGLIIQILAVENFGRALGPHHRDLGGGPCVINIAAQMFGRHHAVSPTKGFAGNDGDFGHRTFAKGIK